MLPDELKALHLDQAALGRLEQAFSARIASGLARDGQEIKALRTYLRPPDKLPGDGRRVAVVDIGGTNCRAAVLVNVGGDFELVAGPVSRPLPVRGAEPLSSTELFDFQAALLAELVSEAGLPLGYCFSYPAEVQPDLDARLIRWTKGVAVPGVVGQLVGRELHAALDRRGIAPSGVVVLNDTVASLLGAALTGEGPARLAIGLIAGTGTNMAGFFDAAHAPKLAGLTDAMALNLESGNFCPPQDLLTEADDEIDRGDRPGSQRFEKAASGHYLPFLFARDLSRLGLSRAPANDPQALDPHAIDPHAIDPHDGARPLAALIDDSRAPALARELARALFDRSADMVAAGLAALLGHYPAGRVAIIAEGSFFWRTPGYAARVGRTLGSLSGAERFELQQREHTNLVGAACAALQAPK